MAEPKWTPGPWEVEERLLIYSGTKWVASAKMYDEEMTLEEAQANARLIAASPDLYEALEFAIAKLREYAAADEMADLEGYGCMDDPYVFIREAVEKGEAALRKARGEEVTAE